MGAPPVPPTSQWAGLLAQTRFASPRCVAGERSYGGRQAPPRAHNPAGPSFKSGTAIVSQVPQTVHAYLARFARPTNYNQHPLPLRILSTLAQDPHRLFTIGELFHLSKDKDCFKAAKIEMYLQKLASLGLVEPSKYNARVRREFTKWFVTPLGYTVELELVQPLYRPYSRTRRAYVTKGTGSPAGGPVQAAVDDVPQPVPESGSIGGVPVPPEAEKVCERPVPPEPERPPDVPPPPHPPNRRGEVSSPRPSAPAKKVPERLMLNSIVIGLCGPAGAGKSTIASALLDNKKWAAETTRAGFADPIRAGLALMGITKVSNYDAYRTYAQMIGAGMRARDPDHWVKLFRQQVVRSPILVFILDDVRYINEIKACDFTFFIQPEFKPKAELSPEQAAHESEAMARAGFNPKIHNAIIPNREGDLNYAVDSITTFLSGTIKCQPFLRSASSRSPSLWESVAEPSSATSSSPTPSGESSTETCPSTTA